jgi:hypothetical protein
MGMALTQFFRPASLAELRKFTAKGPLYDYLKRWAWQDKVIDFQDFLRPGEFDTTNDWLVANSGGTSAANFGIRADIAGGTIQGDTGTTNAGSVSLIGAHCAWLGDLNAGMEIRIKTDIVTNYDLEVGFIDAVPAANAGGVNDEDGPTMVAADAALLAIDTSETFKKLGFYTVGSTANFGPQRTSLGPVPGMTGTTDALPVADTFFTVAVQLVGNNAYLFVNNKLMASHDESKDADGNIEGGVKLAPWVYCRTRTTTAVFPEIDYIATWQDR